MRNEKDIPNVIAPPPLIFLSGLLIGGFANWLFPVNFLPKNLAATAGIVLTIAGLTIILMAVLQMRRTKTNVEPWKPTTAILDTGLYALSRNPIYLGMVLVYLGVSCLFGLIWFLPPLAAVLLTIHFGVILREEKYLTRKFGDEYLSYKNRVRCWI